mmetsp:Transcript_87741/g.165472  ORF Transcript_87741/g.165472 Transcript_87741/m.165472 type:complete len:216 (-) Transcript_87741:1037-1684(-)
MHPDSSASTSAIIARNSQSSGQSPMFNMTDFSSLKSKVKLLSVSNCSKTAHISFNRSFEKRASMEKLVPNFAMRKRNSGHSIKPLPSRSTSRADSSSSASSHLMPSIAMACPSPALSMWPFFNGSKESKIPRNLTTSSGGIGTSTFLFTDFVLDRRKRRRKFNICRAIILLLCQQGSRSSNNSRPPTLASWSSASRSARTRLFSASRPKATVFST